MDILTLEPQNHLNDSIVNFYIKYLIRERLPQRLYQMGISRRIIKDMHIFPTYFYSSMSNLVGGSLYKNSFDGRKQLWKNMKVWTTGVNIFEKKYLIIPVNYALHWTFVLVCHPGLVVGVSAKSDSEGMYQNQEQTKHHCTIPKSFPSFPLRSCILNFDSEKKPRRHRPQTINDVIRKYLNACFENSFYYRPVKLSTPEQIREQAGKVFTSTSMPSLSPICPSQTNTDDCGVYMLDMLEKVVLDPPVVNNQFLEKKGNRWHPFTLKSISDANKKRLEIKAMIYKIIERKSEELDEDDESDE